MRFAVSLLAFALPAFADGGACRPCHASSAPTKDRPALAACPRERLRGARSAEGVPETLTLGRGVEGYGPVVFPHKAHAEAGGAAGCVQCHHYEQAQAIGGCASCHEKERGAGDLATPDRSAAVHRQCLDCHRRLDPEAGCASCHAPLKERPPARATAWVHLRSHAALACARCHAPGAPPAKDCESCHPGWTRGFRHERTGVTLRGAHEALGCADCHGSPFSAKPACAACHEGRSFPKDRP